MSLEVNLALNLPTDASSVAVVRHICGYTLNEVGVDQTCLEDIALALTEACTNVLDHVTNAGEVYEVTISIDDERCAIRVKDAGHGFEVSEREEDAPVDLTSESGRGISMMRSLVDRVNFTIVPDEGTIVHLEKRLVFDEAHPSRRTARASFPV